MDTSRTHRLLAPLFGRPPDINGRGQYRNSVVMVLLAQLEGRLQLVFEKRPSHIRQGDEVSFPGGHRDAADRHSLDTALRETEEELGLTAGHLDVLGRLDTVISPTGIIVEAFVALAAINSLTALALSPEEVAYVFSRPLNWFMAQEPQVYDIMLQAVPYRCGGDGERTYTFPAKELALPARYHEAWPCYSQQVYVYDCRGEVVWGITARLVRDLVERIGLLKGPQRTSLGL